MDVGVRAVLRDAETLDDLGAVTAPAPIEPGDVLGDAEALCRVEVVLLTSPAARCVPVLVRREELGTRVL